MWSYHEPTYRPQLRCLFSIFHRRRRALCIAVCVRWQSRLWIVLEWLVSGVVTICVLRRKHRLDAVHRGVQSNVWKSGNRHCMATVRQCMKSCAKRFQPKTTSSVPWCQGLIHGHIWRRLTSGKLVCHPLVSGWTATNQFNPRTSLKRCGIDGDWVEELSQHCNGVQVHELNACVLTLVSVEASVGDYDKPL